MKGLNGQMGHHSGSSLQHRIPATGIHQTQIPVSTNIPCTRRKIQQSNILRSQLIKQHIRIGIVLHLLLIQWNPLRIIETEPIEFPLIFWIRRHVDKRNVVTSTRRPQMVNHRDQVISRPHSLSLILHHTSFLHSRVFRHVQSLPFTFPPFPTCSGYFTFS